MSLFKSLCCVSIKRALGIKCIVLVKDTWRVASVSAILRTGDIYQTGNGLLWLMLKIRGRNIFLKAPACQTGVVIKICWSSHIKPLLETIIHTKLFVNTVLNEDYTLKLSLGSFILSEAIYFEIIIVCIPINQLKICVTRKLLKT